MMKKLVHFVCIGLILTLATISFNGCSGGGSSGSSPPPPPPPPPPAPPAPVPPITNFFESFDSGALNLSYWDWSGEFDRKQANGAMEYNLSTASYFGTSYISFKDESCETVSADVTITSTDPEGADDVVFGTRLESCGYHTTTEGEESGNRTGDVSAAIILRGSEAFYQVFRCLKDECADSDSIAHLTPGTKGRVPLGNVKLGTTANLKIDWNKINREFTFQLDDQTPVNFDPAAAGATVDSAVPNMPVKYLGPKLVVLNLNDPVKMTATFDNIWVNGNLYDDFDTGAYLDGSAWHQTNGKRAIDETGRLLLETGQEFVGDPVADYQFHSTELTSNENLNPDSDLVEGDLTLESTTLVDFDGEPTEVYATLEMTFRPEGASKRDYTNTFMIQTMLKEDPLGVTAGVNAIGCIDFACDEKHTIANDNKTFNTSVEKSVPYRFKIEHVGNGLIEITLDGSTLDESETLSFDLSAIPEFASTEFTGITLKTRSRGTDREGEEAFVQAFFDNIRVGTP